MRNNTHKLIGAIVGGVVTCAVFILVVVLFTNNFKFAIKESELKSKNELDSLNKKRDNYLSGTHDLKKSIIYLQNGDSVNSYITGIKSDILSFYWKDNDGYYNYCENLRDNIKYEIDESLNVPSVTFKWKSCELNYDDNYKNYIAITEIIIKGKEKDLTEVKL